MEYLATPKGKRVYSIYKATNLVNGKVYIGFDSNWPKRRNAHKYNTFTKNSDYIFHRAIRKHGWDNFEWEVICQSLDGNYLKDIIEPYFIKQYESFGPKGYNLTAGGGGILGYKHNSNTKKKMSDAQINVPKSENHLIKIREFNKNRKPTLQAIEAARKVNTGTSKSIEMRQKLSLSKTGIPRPKYIADKLREYGAKKYLIITPNNEQIEILNLTKFCRKNNLNIRTFREYIRNNIKYKGYSAKRIL